MHLFLLRILGGFRPFLLNEGSEDVGLDLNLIKLLGRKSFLL